MAADLSLLPRAEDLDDLLERDRDDVLSVALATDPTAPENQAVHPAYLIWLENALRDLLRDLPPPRRRVARPLAQRVRAYVRTRKPAARGLALFAAPDLWRVYPVQVPLSNRLRFGLPDVTALLEALDACPPYAILAVDTRHARLAMGYLGNASLLAEETLDLHTEHWRQTAGRRPTAARRMGEGAGRGTQRDPFEARRRAHVQAFWEHVAAETARLLAERGLRALVVGGPDEATAAVARALPPQARRALVGTVPLPRYEGLAEMLQRTVQAAVEAERRRDRELVAGVLEAQGTRAVLGWPAVDEALRLRQAHLVVVEPSRLAHHPELPRLVRRAGARLELVHADAAAPLAAHGGIAALLKSPSASAG